MLNKNEVKGLLPYATTLQASYINAFIRKGTLSKAAQYLGKSCSSVQEGIARARKTAAGRGYSPTFPGHHHPVPDGFGVERVTELVRQDGKPSIKWVRSNKDKVDLAEQLAEVLEGIVARVDGMAKAIPSPDLTEAAQDMAVIVPMGDPHVGMYSWAKEAEADWDVELAEKLMIQAVEHLVDVSPEAEEFILINLGDFFHADNSQGTTTSGTPVDTDGRWARVQEIGFMIMVRCIERALKKYPKITVHNAIGNHDEHTSQALSATLSAWFRNEPRVTIVKSPSRFWYYKWGQTMIGVHHGHSTQAAAMPLAMASHEPKMWGDSQFRYIYLGHKHHKYSKEFPGVTVEQFRTLAPKDAWHFGNAAYISMRDMQSIHIHRHYGEVGRRICPVAYLEKDCDQPEIK